MTVVEFQRRFGGDLRIFLRSETGIAFIQVLGMLRGKVNLHLDPNSAALQLGRVSGYEDCIENMIFLSTDTPKPAAVEATYGVTKPKEGDSA